MIPLKFTVIEDGGPKAMKTQLNRILKETLFEICRFWWRNMLPLHFTRRARAEYKYKPRSQKHLKAKMRKFGHNVDLVFTGDLKDLVMGRADIFATRARASITLHGPRYLYQKPTDEHQPDMAAELTAVSQRDLRRLVKRGNDVLVKKLAAVKGRKRTRIR